MTHYLFSMQGPVPPGGRIYVISNSSHPVDHSCLQSTCSGSAQEEVILLELYPSHSMVTFEDSNHLHLSKQERTRPWGCPCALGDGSKPSSLAILIPRLPWHPIIISKVSTRYARSPIRMTVRGACTNISSSFLMENGMAGRLGLVWLYPSDLPHGEGGSSTMVLPLRVCLASSPLSVKSVHLWAAG